MFPNCTAKAKGERQLYVGDGLLQARELGGMVIRRPHDRVSHASQAWSLRQDLISQCMNAGWNLQAVNFSQCKFHLPAPAAAEV